MKRFLLLLMCLTMLLPFAACAEEKPKPVPLLAEDEIPATPTGIHNYLLLCVDSWDGQVNNLGNTDGVVLVTVDEFAGRLMLTSFIRDLLVQKDDGTFNRLSRYVPHNGHNKEAVEKLVNVFATHFGVRIDNYVVVDWTMIRNIIDAAGGVDITVTAGEATRLKDKKAYMTSWTEPKLAGAGTYHFTGYAAVIYMRIRSGSVVDGEAYDFRRTSRARSVLMNIAEELRGITYEDALSLLDVVVENTLATDMSATDLLTALDLAYGARGLQIEQLRIPIKGTYEGITYTGGACQQIDYVANRKALHDFLYDSYIVRDDE